LVSGKWDVSADTISLQEVRNPNGVFNAVGSGNPPAPNRFLFDYDPSDSVSLAARNSILLGAGASPRIPNASVPSVFPPSLAMAAGAGGITIAQALSLFPSPSGQLAITTTDGGSLSGTGIFMSDTREKQWVPNSGRFTDDGSFTPPGHLADQVPALIDISGSIRSFNLTLPKPVDVRVAGDVADSSFRIQNLRPTDVSSFNVGGSITFRSEYSFFKLPTEVSDANLSQLKNAVNGLVSTPDLRYDSVSRLIGIRGRMSKEQADGLANLTTYTFGPGGSDPIIGPNGEPITTTVRVLPDAIIAQLFAASQASYNGTFAGFQLGGPGQVRFNAGSMDLGSSRGIDSYGPGLNRALGSVAPRGADVFINTRDNLVMFSSAIRSRAGGAIAIDSGGRIEVGSKLVVAESDVARGIYSTAGSPVTVTATGNVDANGSRIATFDGGRVTVLSRQGNVDAGSGGLAVQAVNQIVVTPDGSVTEESSTIPGSGILTATFLTGSARVGDISVNAPRGDVIARQGGIIQMPFNGTPYGEASVQVNAGTRAPDNTVLYQGSIDATGSGVIGGNVALNATGPVLGVVVASGNINIVTPQNVNVTALAQGNVSIGAGGTVSGTVVGVGGISASGASISASLLSQNVSTSGGTSGQVGLAAANVAGATSTAAAGTAAATTTAATSPKTDGKDEEKNRGNRRLLARTVGRVTVSLPKSP
jgi:hypothetical protein